MPDLAANFKDQLKWLLSQTKYVEKRSVHFPETKNNLVDIQSGKYFTSPDDNRGMAIAVETAAWGNTCLKLREAFRGRVTAKTLALALSLYDIGSFEWPLDRETIESWADFAFNYCLGNSTRTLAVYIPLNCRFVVTDIKNIRLGRASLHFNKTSKQLSNLVRLESDNLPLGFTINGDGGYLKYKAFGDHRLIERESTEIADEAFAIFRFTYPWTKRLDGDTYSYDCDAIDLAVNIAESSFVLHRKVYKGRESKLGYHSQYLPPRIYFSKEDYLDAKRRGLDDLNFHARHQHTSTVSRAIMRALYYYDSGIMATKTWQAVYRFATCMEVAFAGEFNQHNNSQYVQDSFSKILSTSKTFKGFFPHLFPEFMELSKDTNWKDRYPKILPLVKDIYQTRNKLLHGRALNPSADQVQIARTLANNAVRIMARLSRTQKWSNWKQAYKWLASEIESPRVKCDVEGD